MTDNTEKLEALNIQDNSHSLEDIQGMIRELEGQQPYQGRSAQAFLCHAAARAIRDLMANYPEKPDSSRPNAPAPDAGWLDELRPKLSAIIQKWIYGTDHTPSENPIVIDGATDEILRLIALARQAPAPAVQEGVRLFAKAVLRDGLWDGSSLDGADIQDLAEKHGLIENVGFDPEKHTDHYGVGLEAGDEWYQETSLLAQPTPPSPGQGDGWLPIVLCPTDGQPRALKLPDGREVVGSFHNPGGWTTTSTIEYGEPVYEEPLRGGFIASTELRPARQEPERKLAGHRRAKMHVVGKLPEGVHPTHFRPNDTVYGQALAASPPPPQGTGAGGADRVAELEAALTKTLGELDVLIARAESDRFKIAFERMAWDLRTALPKPPLTGGA